MAYATVPGWSPSLGSVDTAAALALPLVLIPAVVAFAARCACAGGVPHSERLDRLARSPGLPRVVMEFGYWMFRAPIELCVRLGLTPNLLTLASLLLTGGAAVCFGRGLFAIGGWLLLAAFTLDAWDGILARRLGRASPAGEFLDATVDRYSDLIAFLGLMYYYRNDPWPLALAAAAMVGTTLVSYTRAKGEALGVDPHVGYMQRQERAVYLGGATVLAPLLAAGLEPHALHPRYHLTVGVLALIALLTNVTAVWRARVVLRALSGAHPAPPERAEHADRTMRAVGG
jgi:CDP-diacylglycerol--glycerol-3-phosphate 3-phosphatidyltransferase